VTELVLACTIVLAVRDVPLANIDHAIERHLGREDQSSHRVTSPPFGKEHCYPMAASTIGGKRNSVVMRPMLAAMDGLTFENFLRAFLPVGPFNDPLQIGRELGGRPRLRFAS
jgi:hypothetical protein